MFIGKAEWHFNHYAKHPLKVKLTINLVDSYTQQHTCFKKSDTVSSKAGY